MRRILYVGISLIIAITLGIPMAMTIGASTFVEIDFEGTGLSPGDSVEGLGTVHDDLNIQSKGDAQLIKKDDNTALSYNAPGGRGTTVVSTVILDLEM